MAISLLISLLSANEARAQQDLGHKIPGTLGLDAGVQPDAGVYVSNRFLIFDAASLVDRHGDRIPVDVDINVLTDSVGVGGVYELPRRSTFVGCGVGVPVARMAVGTARPEGTLDRLGIADIYVQPVKLGWRLPHVDLVTGYAFFVPTGRSAEGERGAVSSHSFSHDLSLGGAILFDEARTWRVTALGTYSLNQRRMDIDVTRGDTIQIQGGAGKTLFDLLDVGVVGYAIWQVRDDRGADVPRVLRGARDRAYGLGAEVGMIIPPIRSRVLLRYAHDLDDVARPVGQILLFGLTFSAWKPERP